MLSATGEDIAVASRKHQVLIARLALANGRPISRSKLAGLLWAEQTEDHARNSLRQGFFSVRRAVEGHGPAPFLMDADSAWIERDEIVSDVQILVGAATDQLPFVLDKLEGEFLEGLKFNDETLDEWLRIERDRHRTLLIDFLTSVADCVENAGDTQQSLQIARCLLRHDPYHEPSHRVILRNHLERGERGRAIGHYDTMRALLQSDLAVSPDAETLNLMDRIHSPPEQPFIALTDTRPRLAILPIKSRSGHIDEQTLTDALTRDLIGELARFSPISVVAAATMFTLSGKNLAVDEIGRRLDANYILEVAILSNGSSLAQLVSVQSGTQIWSRKYLDADVRFPAGQEKLVHRISGNLYQFLMKHAASNLAMTSEEGANSEQLYLQVFYHVERPTLKGMIRARRLCNRLLIMDPGHVLVRESLAWINFHSCFNGWLNDPLRGFRDARDLAMTGMGLDDREPYLLSAYSLAEMYLGNTKSGLEGLQRAVDLNPNDAEFHTWLGIGLTLVGRFDEAHAAFDEADQVSPDYHPIFLFRGDAHFTSGNYENAISCLNRFLVVLPEYHWGRLLRGAAHEALGNAQAAKEDVSYVRQNALMLTGQYLQQLLHARSSLFKDGLWLHLCAAGLPWS
ncbi:tetratricopeptide repeat protein [Phyllobacterium sp. LjRoot231]|uniref:BTAD domain-containing putative transcriptional regulator n=1 Tax=Phyllobacterium sp. LjRoot231 TaxID=3342289 RepID=UPI003ECF7963